MKTAWKNLWENIKHTNIQIIGVPEEEEKEKGSEKIFEENIVKNFPNMGMGMEIVNQVQGTQRVPYRINSRRNMPRHILIKLTKIKYKEKILKAAREKQQITYKGGLPWWCSGWESTCQCRGHRFEPWSGKIPHAVEQLGPWATTTEPARLEPVLRNKRGHDSERPMHRDEEWPPLTATRESPHTETKTQHSQK